MIEYDQAGQETGKKSERMIPEILRKGILAGLGGLFGAEEGVRSTFGELKLPKEVVQYFMQQLGKAKDELIHRISEEVRDFLRSSVLTEQLKKVLYSTSLQVSTTIRFVENDTVGRPRISTTWEIKKRDKKSTSKKPRIRKSKTT